MSTAPAIVEDTTEELSVELEDTNIEEAAEAHTYGPGATRRLTALRLLEQREPLLESRLKAQQKHWSKELTELTQKLKGLIKSDNPKGSEARLAKLVEIQEALENREEAEREKKKDLDDCNAAIKANRAAWKETIEADVESLAQQQQLFEETRQLAEGLELTEGTLELIDAAAREVLKASPEASAAFLRDVEELTTALAAMKISGMHLVTPTSDAVVAEGELEDHSAEGDVDEDDPGF